MLTKQEFETHLKWELPVITKVIAAIPEEGFDFRPHEKSRSAKELAKALIAEIPMTEAFLRGESVTAESAGSFYAGIDPQTVAEAVQLSEKVNAQLLQTLSGITDEQLKARVTFFVRETIVDDALFNMMLDLIHHRGQLSAYIRPAGGKVPSIYGPSADEEFHG